MSVRPAPVFAPLTPRALVLAVLAMGAVVLLSNLSGRVPGQQPDQPPLRPRPGPPRGVDRVPGGGAAVDLGGHAAHRHCFMLGVHRGAAAGHHRVRPPAPWQLVARADGGNHLQCHRGYHHFLVDRVCRFGAAVGELGRRRPGGEAGDRRVPAGPVPRAAVEDGAAARHQLTALLWWVPTLVGTYQQQANGQIIDPVGADRWSARSRRGHEP
ncbi:hypothetical protein G6F65_011541 [Rhizopus arrhizus]|nr:hypothetical protein G6F65_011541 [Rhizopus arrhizus]